MKEKITITSVPWQISPSTPDMAIINADDEGNLSVEFLGTHLLEDGNFYQCCITLNFKGCIKSIYSPCYEELSLFDEEKYDMSEISKNYQPEFSRSLFFDKWKKNNACADSGFYLVQSNKDLYGGYKNYILIGAEAMIDLFAKGYEWSSKKVNETAMEPAFDD